MTNEELVDEFTKAVGLWERHGKKPYNLGSLRTELMLRLAPISASPRPKCPECGGDVFVVVKNSGLRLKPAKVVVICIPPTIDGGGHEFHCQNVADFAQFFVPSLCERSPSPASGVPIGDPE